MNGSDSGSRSRSSDKRPTYTRATAQRSTCRLLSAFSVVATSYLVLGVSTCVAAQFDFSRIQSSTFGTQVGVCGPGGCGGRTSMPASSTRSVPAQDDSGRRAAERQARQRADAEDARRIRRELQALNQQIHRVRYTPVQGRPASLSTATRSGTAWFGVGAGPLATFETPLGKTEVPLPLGARLDLAVAILAPVLDLSAGLTDEDSSWMAGRAFAALEGAQNEVLITVPASPGLTPGQTRFLTDGLRRVEEALYRVRTIAQRRLEVEGRIARHPARFVPHGAEPTDSRIQEVSALQDELRSLWNQQEAAMQDVRNQQSELKRRVRVVLQ